MTTDVHSQEGEGDYASVKDKCNFGLFWLTLRLCGYKQSVTQNTKVISSKYCLHELHFKHSYGIYIYYLYICTYTFIQIYNTFIHIMHIYTLNIYKILL